ncbi:hypothetical protein, partial [Streptomyces galilaeus]|uniref:hypothetical protein n=1 Tax=Streptomyces galilaeus TaxID=33899 RepID=UPI0038F78E02
AQIMSKFTRVSENNSEQSVVNRFASRQELPTNDAYAELLAGTNERRAQISRETVDVQRERKLLKQSEHEWEKAPVMATYKQPSMNKPMEEA